MDSRRTRNARTLLWLAAGVLGAVGAYFARFGRVNADEGFYLYAAGRLCAGHLPYRDFPFFQGPALLLLHAIPQCLAPGLETGRWTTFALSAVTVALSLRLALERGGAVAVAVLVGGIVGAPLAAWALVTTRTEPLSAFCWVVAAWCLLRPRRDSRHRALALVAAVLAAATRISSLPASAFVAVWALRGASRDPRGAGRVVLPALVLALGIAALVLAGGPERVWVQLVEVQSQRHEQFHPASGGAGLWLAAKADFGGRLVRELGVVPALSLGVALGVALLWAWRPGGRREPGRLAAAGPMALLALLAWLPNLVPLLAYPVYLVSVLPLLLVVLGVALARALERWSRRGRGGQRLALVAGVAALAIAQGWTWLATHEQWARRSPSDLVALRQVARSLARDLPADRWLVSLDPALAVESGRRLPPGFEMGLFSWFPRRPPSDGERLGLLTTDRLLAAFASLDVGMVALSDEALGVLVHGRYGGYRPWRILSESELWQVFPPLRDHRLLRVVPSFGAREAPLYLLRPERSP